MPWRDYIISVGSAFLALLFAIDGLMPQTAFSETSRAEVKLPPIRIRSEAKGPEAVDTDHPSLRAAADQEVAVPEPIALPRSQSRHQLDQATTQPTVQQAATADVSAPVPAPFGLETSANVGQPYRSASNKPATARSASPARRKGRIQPPPRQQGERFGYAACEWRRPPNTGQLF